MTIDSLLVDQLTFGLFCITRKGHGIFTLHPQARQRPHNQMGQTGRQVVWYRSTLYLKTKFYPVKSLQL